MVYSKSACFQCDITITNTFYVTLVKVILPTNNLCISPLIFEHRKFSGNSFNFRFLKKLFEYFTFVFKNVRRDTFGLYTYIMYIC